MTTTPSFFDQALRDPAKSFADPDAVVDHEALTADQKLAILRRWDYDARELAVAEDESMGGGEKDDLARIRRAIRRLGRRRRPGGATQHG